jgi:TPR repeat protein
MGTSLRRTSRNQQGSADAGIVVVTMKTWMLSRAVALLLASYLGAAAAAPPLGAALQGELDRAVLDYESGRIETARKALESLAVRGVPAAQYNLAVMHLRAEVPQPDRQLALRLLTRAAEGGFVTAQFMLAQSLENGVFGARDLVLAHRWYEVAALSGSVDAQVAMGTAHYLGRGARKDAAEAARWYREAANGGDVGAMYLLASMYEQGYGVAQDLRLARYWYDIAARNGDEAAPGKLKEVDAKLRAS